MMDNNLIYFAISGHDDEFVECIDEAEEGCTETTEYANLFSVENPHSLLNLPDEETLFKKFDVMDACFRDQLPYTEKELRTIIDIPLISLNFPSINKTIKVYAWFKGLSREDWTDTEDTESYYLFTIDKETLEVSSV